MDVWRFQVTNFKKQCQRVDRWNLVASNKVNKTSSFTDLANLLMNSSCPNNQIEIDNLVDTLKKCNESVTSACTLTKVDEDFVRECKKKSEAFVVSIHFRF